MITKELIDYVEGELKKGEQKDAIKARLLQNDWSSGDIEEVFKVVEDKISNQANIFIPRPDISPATSTSFWDFIHRKAYKNYKEKIYDFIFGFLGLGVILNILNWLLGWVAIFDDYSFFLPSLLISIFFLFLRRKYVIIGFFSIILLFLAYLFLLFASGVQ